MANVDIAVQSLVSTALTPTYTAIVSTNSYFVDRRDGRLLLVFKNTGTEATITFDVTKTQNGVAFADPTVVVAATTGEEFVGDFGPVYVVNADDELKFTVSAAGTVTVAALDCIPE